MKTKDLKKFKFEKELNQKNFFERNKTKPLYIITKPFFLIFYYILFIWLFKKNSWIKKNVSPIWKLINVSFLTSPATVFISFVLPIVFIFILGFISNATTAIVGRIAQIPVMILIISMPIIFVDFKRSSILKRLYVSQIKKSIIIFSFVSYFMLMCLISTFLTAGLGFLFFWDRITTLFFETKELSKMVPYIQWGQFLFGVTLNIIFSAAIGIIVSSYAKTPLFALAIGLIVLIPGGFLSGQYFSLGMILENDYLRYLSYVFWQKYPTAIIVSSFDLTNVGSHYISYNIFGDKDWNVVMDFVGRFPEKLKNVTDGVIINKILSALKVGHTDLAQELVNQLGVKLKGLETISMNDFIQLRYLTVLTPTLAWISIVISIFLPIPIFMAGIKKFRWSTR